MRLLAELGADLNLRNGSGETPLILVCRRGHAEAAKFLLEMRADPEAPRRSQRKAVEKKTFNLLNLLFT